MSTPQSPLSYTHDEFIYTCRTMQAYGGSFAYKLAELLYVADMHNRQRLLAAFPELMQQYGPDSDFYVGAGA